MSKERVAIDVSIDTVGDIDKEGEDLIANSAAMLEEEARDAADDADQSEEMGDQSKDEEGYPDEEEEEEDDKPNTNINVQISVSIGPLNFEEVMNCKSRDLKYLLTCAPELSMTFKDPEDKEEKEENGESKEESKKQDKVGYVKVSYAFKTSKMLVEVADKLSTLKIQGRNLAVNFPEEFKNTIEENRKLVKELEEWNKQRQNREKRRLFANNIPPQATEEMLKTHFTECSKVIIPKSSKVGDVHMYAILEFSTPEACYEYARKNVSQTIDGQKVKIERVHCLSSSYTLGKVVYANGIPPHMTEGLLKDLVPACVEAKISKNEDGTPKKYAVLLFDNRPDATKAQRKREIEIGSYKVKLEFKSMEDPDYGKRPAYKEFSSRGKFSPRGGSSRRGTFSSSYSSSRGSFKHSDRGGRGSFMSRGGGPGSVGRGGGFGRGGSSLTSGFDSRPGSKRLSSFSDDYSDAKRRNYSGGDSYRTSRGGYSDSRSGGSGGRYSASFTTNSGYR